jgi:hypothetical protein
MLGTAAVACFLRNWPINTLATTPIVPHATAAQCVANENHHCGEERKGVHEQESYIVTIISICLQPIYPSHFPDPKVYSSTASVYFERMSFHCFCFVSLGPSVVEYDWRGVRGMPVGYG